MTELQQRIADHEDYARFLSRNRHGRAYRARKNKQSKNGEFLWETSRWNF